MNDSIERIKEDAIKPFYEYWNCEEIDDCNNCPSKIGGLAPDVHYGISGCLRAMKLDLIERTIKVMDIMEGR